MKTWTLIRDLEEAVFNLKEHLLSIDASSYSSKTDRTDAAIMDPDPEKSEQRHMEESYPEFNAQLQDKKEVHESYPEFTAELQDKKEVHGSKTQKLGKDDDMSLKEALQFLVSLAKEKKKEESREHGSAHASHH